MAEIAAPTLKPRLNSSIRYRSWRARPIGSGIFIVSAGIAREVRSPALLLLVWIAASLMSVTGALTVAELAGMMPVAGGQYIFLREPYGGMCAFLFGWTIVAVVHTGSIAAVAIVLQSIWRYWSRQFIRGCAWALSPSPVSNWSRSD